MWYPGSLTNFSFNRLTACSFWFVFSLFTAPNISAQEAVILEHGIGEALPEFEELWTLPVEGEVMDIEIPRNKNVDHFYCVTEDAETFRLYRVTLKGELLWMREWKKEKPYYYVYGLKASHSGNLVAVHRVDGAEENVRSKVYDSSGNELFYKPYGDGFFYPSPSGRYLTYQNPNNYTPLDVYMPTGEVVEIANKSFLKGEWHTHRFVADDKLLVYESFEGRGYLSLITVPSGEVLWTREFESPVWLIDFNERNATFNEDHIVVQGTRRPADIVLLNYAGSILWRFEDFSNHKVSFSSDGRYVISVDRGQSVNVLDVQARETVGNVWIHKNTLLNRPEFDFFENTLLIGQAYASRGLRKKLGFGARGDYYWNYFAYIVQLDSAGEKKRLYALKGTLATKYNPESGDLLIVNSNNDVKTVSGRIKHVKK